jgi:hypothetical protein
VYVIHKGDSRICGDPIEGGKRRFGEYRVPQTFMQPMLGVAGPVHASSCEQDYVYDEQIRQ